MRKPRRTNHAIQNYMTKLAKINFMKLALDEASKAATKDEVPVGAVIVEDGRVIASTHNQNRELNDPTAHAEILALRLAAQVNSSVRLDGCDIYVTLEPCAMCAAAISLARIRRIYYATSDIKFGAVENGARIFNATSCHHRPEVYSGFYEEESKKLLRDFFKSKR